MMLNLVFVDKNVSINNLETDFVSRGYHKVNECSPLLVGDCIKQESDGTYSNYKFQVEFTKNYSSTEKTLFRIKAFCEIFFSLGLGLFSKNVQQDLEKALSDKEIVQIYTYDKPILENPLKPFF